MFPQRSKDRLYVAHYIRVRTGEPEMDDEEDRFHWALLIGPKREDTKTNGKRFHVKDDGLPATWALSVEDTGTIPAMRLLTRTLVGKIKNRTLVEDILNRVPIRTGTVQGWNDVFWVREALAMIGLNEAAMGTSMLEWDKVRRTAM